MGEFDVIETLPDSKLLEERRGFRTHFAAYRDVFLFALHFNLYRLTLQLANADEAFLAFQRTLIENNHVANLLLSLSCQFGMELSLRFPNPFKLIKIVLAIEYHVFQTDIGILFQHFHLVLSHCQILKIQLFASVTDFSKIIAGIVDDPI